MSRRGLAMTAQWTVLSAVTVSAATLWVACSDDERPAAAPMGSGGASGAGGAAGAPPESGGAADSGVSAGASNADAAAPSDAPSQAAGGSAGTPGFSDSGVEPTGPDASCSPSPQCRTFCEGLAKSADCGLNDSDVLECSCQCDRSVLPTCAAELSAVLSCGGEDLSLSCGDGAPLVLGCEAESNELDVCSERAAGHLCAEEIPACRDFCDAVLDARCDRGAHALTDCLCGCEQKVAGPCPAEWEAFVACSGGTFELSCNVEGEVVGAGACASEWTAIEQCF